MVDIKKLKKEADILNSEGTILGLYQAQSVYYLGSYLTDGSGMVYYSILSLSILKDYFNSKLTLKELYNDSKDFIVTTKFRKETASFIKEDLASLIKLGDKFYNELSVGLKNKEFEDKISRF